MQVEDVELAVRKLSHTAVPITLSWHELSYDVMIPVINKPRKILSSVSGWGEPSDMVALLGSEAGGKTALLNCLAGIWRQSFLKIPQVRCNDMYVLKYMCVLWCQSLIKELRLGCANDKRNHCKSSEEHFMLTRGLIRFISCLQKYPEAAPKLPSKNISPNLHQNLYSRYQGH